MNTITSYISEKYLQEVHKKKQHKSPQSMEGMETWRKGEEKRMQVETNVIQKMRDRTIKQRYIL